MEPNDDGLKVAERDESNRPLAGFEREVQRNYRWNFAVNALDIGFFFGSLSFVSATTVLPAFLSHLTGSNTVIGTISALRTLGYLLPQIMVANYLERLDRKKWFVVAVSTGERLPWLFLALFSPFMIRFPTTVNLAIFIFLYAAVSFSGGVATPAWLDMIGKVIPERKRGGFFGAGNFLGGALGIAGAIASVYLLRNYPFPTNFSLLFFCSFAVTFLSWVALALNREPAYPLVRERATIKEFLARLPAILGKDKNFRSYLIASVFLSFSGMAGSFFTLAAIRRLGATDDQVGGFTLIFVISQTLTNLFWGYLGDKKGYKLLTALGALGQIAAALIAVWANSISLFYVIFAITGSALSLEMIANLNIVLEFGPREERPTYIGLANTIRSPFTGLAPVLGGVIADRLSFEAVFLTTIAFVVLGFLWLSFAVVEPRKYNPMSG